MSSGKRLSVLVAVVFLAVFVGSCLAPQFYIPQAERTSPSYIGSAHKDRNLDVVLEHFILPNGSGSWVKDAPWYELILTIRNASRETITISQISMVDENGIIRPQAESYQSLSRMRQQIEQSATSVEYAGVATEVILSAFLPIFAGFGSRAAGGQVRQESNLMQQEFARRQIQSVSFIPDGSGRGSVFFPLHRNPREIRISYMTGVGQSRELIMSLSSLKDTPSKEKPTGEIETPKVEAKLEVSTSIKEEKGDLSVKPEY